MTDFVSLRDRDATNSIRGYVYQVDLTIERWLGLKPGQTLELECGEDIDQISESFAKPQEQQRLLEQVKLRATPLTLRTPSAIAAIANFIEHRSANPQLNLLFRYSTNATVVRERPSPMAQDVPAIEAWESIRLGTLSEHQLADALTGIRAILKNAIKPSDIPENTWNSYMSFVSRVTDSQFLELVRVFEWSTGGPTDREMSSRIQANLSTLNLARNARESEEQYYRLFYYVFDLLCQPIVKQLTVDNLKAQISQPPLAKDERELLNSIFSMTKLLDARVSKVERRFIRLDTQMRQLAQKQAVDAAVDYTVSTPVLDVPPAVTHLSRRRETVATFAEAVKSCAWLAIYGGVGTGKTQLAILLIQSLGVCKAWISMRDFSDMQASLRLDSAFQSLTGSMPQSNRYEWYCQACSSFPNNAFIVIDDLPRLTGDDPLSERLLPLVRACQQCNVRLLTTSAYSMSKKVQDSLEPSLLYVTEIPSFSDYETAEVFHAFGAPSSFFKPESVSFINGLAHQHPVLISAAAKYMQQQNWHFSDDALDILLKGEYATEISKEVTYRLLKTIEDTENRLLLYRLNLIWGDFSLEDIEAVAYVDPAIERVRERLHALTGLWLQGTARDRLTVSPLVRALGTKDLRPRTRKACELALGKRILQKGMLNQSDAVQAITHFANGGAHNQAGSLLAGALSKISAIDEQINDYGLLSMWIDLPIPQQMRLGLRLYIRGLQISIRQKLGKDITYLTADVDLIVNESSKDRTWGIISLLAVSGEILATYDSTRVNRLLLIALQSLPTALDPLGKPLLMQDDLQVGSLIWLSVGGINTEEQLREWMSILEQMPSDLIKAGFADPVAENSCLFVTEGLWLKELDKPSDQRQWNIVLRALGDLAARSWRLGLELLWACAIRAQIVVFAAHMNDFSAALELAGKSLAVASNDTRVQFLLHESLGRQYIDLHDYDSALLHFQLALDQPAIAYPKVRIGMLLGASLAVGSNNSQMAIQYASQAVHIAETMEQISELDLAKTLGELAIAHWLAGDLHSAFDAWDKAAEHLLACRTESDNWKGFYVIFGHASGYLSLLAHTGEPPDKILDGEPYVAPTRGFFQIDRPWLATRYKKELDSFLYAQMAMFAEAIGKDEKVSHWALRGMDLAKVQNQPSAFSKLSEDYLPFMICSDRYAETLDVAVSAGIARVTTLEVHRTGGDSLSSELNAEAILGAKPNAFWNRGEYYAAIIGLLPIAFRIGTLAINQIERARPFAREVTALCGQISATASDPSLWLTAADLIEKIFLHQTASNDLIQLSNNIDSDNYQVLRVVGYLGATLQRDADLRDSLSAHLAFMPYVFGILRPPSTMYRRVIVPFIVEYWTNAFKRARFLFRTPKVIDEYLIEAQKTAEERRAQVILHIMAFGLGIRPPANVEQWLHNK